MKADLLAFFNPEKVTKTPGFLLYALFSTENLCPNLNSTQVSGEILLLFPLKTKNGADNEIMLLIFF
jgi:hypothetical protein